MKQESKEVLAGIILTILLAGIVSFVHLKSALPEKETDFILFAYFSNSDGVMKGTPIRLGGIQVGEVTGEKLADEYRVRLQLSFYEKLSLSADTSALIETDGLLGPKHIELIAGGEDDLLKTGDELAYTQDAVVLNVLMDKVNQHMRRKKNIPDVGDSQNLSSDDGFQDSEPIQP